MGVGSKPATDSTGRPIQRTAATIKGWHYQAFFFEYETSTGNIYCKDYTGNDLSSSFSILRYNNSGEITTTNADVVKDVITWKPDHDYEVVSANLKQGSKPASDLRMFVTGGMYNESTNDTPISVKSFVEGGMNLKFFDEVKTDGRASKYMPKTTEGAPYSTNRFQFTLKHHAGLEHSILISMETFKE